jgi:hypothetical protein
MVSAFPKEHPITEEGEALIPLTERLEDFLKARHADVKAADDARTGWIEDQRYYLRRRLQLEFRNSTFPFVNCSQIVPPLIDMQVDKLKPGFLNMVFVDPAIVAFVAQKPESVLAARNAELYFNWFLKRRCENLYATVAVGVDHLLQYGHVVFKVIHEHRSNCVTEVIVRNQLPAGFQAVMVQKGMTEDIAEEIYNATDGQVAPLTKREFDKPEFKAAARAAVLQQFALNDDVDVDSKAADTIMDFLRNPEKYPDDKCVFKKRENEYSAPKLYAVSPVDIVVPKGAKLIQDCAWICHRMTGFTADRLRQMGRDMHWNKAALERVLDKSRTSHGAAEIQELDPTTVAGESSIGVPLNEMPTESFEIRELYCWYDIDRDGFVEKCLITYAPNGMEILKAQELPYDHGKWPFVKIDFEQTSHKYYASRGVPAKIDDLDMEITANHRAKLDRMTIANAPSFLYDPQLFSNPNMVRWIPGAFYPTRDIHNGVAPLQIPVLDMSYDKEEEILRMWAEQHIGGTDFALHGQGSLTEPRTAQEIRAVEFNRQQVLSVRGRAFQQGMAEVWDMMWDLMMQVPQDDIWVQTTGSDPIHFTRKEIQGNFDLVPVGAIGESDPVFKAQKALARVQVLMQAAPVVAQDPKYELNLGEALLQWLEQDDVVAARSVIRRRTPEEVAAIMAQQQRAAQLASSVINGTPQDPATLAMMASEMMKVLPRGKMQQVQQAAQAVAAQEAQN